MPFWEWGWICVCVWACALSCRNAFIFSFPYTLFLFLFFGLRCFRPLSPKYQLVHIKSEHTRVSREMNLNFSPALLSSVMGSDLVSGTFLNCRWHLMLLFGRDVTFCSCRRKTPIPPSLSSSAIFSKSAFLLPIELSVLHSPSFSLRTQDQRIRPRAAAVHVRVGRADAGEPGAR